MYLTVGNTKMSQESRSVLLGSWPTSWMPSVVRKSTTTRDLFAGALSWYSEVRRARVLGRRLALKFQHLWHTVGGLAVFGDCALFFEPYGSHVTGLVHEHSHQLLDHTALTLEFLVRLSTNVYPLNRLLPGLWV